MQEQIAELVLNTTSFSVGCLSGIGFLALCFVVGYAIVKARAFRRSH